MTKRKRIRTRKIQNRRRKRSRSNRKSSRKNISVKLNTQRGGLPGFGLNDTARGKLEGTYDELVKNLDKSTLTGVLGMFSKNSPILLDRDAEGGYRIHLLAATSANNEYKGLATNVIELGKNIFKPTFDSMPDSKILENLIASFNEDEVDNKITLIDGADAVQPVAGSSMETLVEEYSDSLKKEKIEADNTKNLLQAIRPYIMEIRPKMTDLQLMRGEFEKLLTPPGDKPVDKDVLELAEECVQNIDNILKERQEAATSLKQAAATQKIEDEKDAAAHDGDEWSKVTLNLFLATINTARAGGDISEAEAIFKRVFDDWEY
jgi:hypothetical protein